MKLSKEDKDRLIILGVFIFIIAFIAVSYHYTRFIPLPWLAAAAFIAMYVLSVVITRKYFNLYYAEANAISFIPFVNSITTFPPVLAILMSISLVVTIITVVIVFLPSSVAMAIMPVDVALNYSDTAMMWFYVAFILMFIIYGIGYDAVYHDVRRMLREATGMKRPTSEYSYFVVMLIPILNVLGLAALVTSINTLERFGYHEGDAIDENAERFKEVE